MNRKIWNDSRLAFHSLPHSLYYLPTLLPHVPTSFSGGVEVLLITASFQFPKRGSERKRFSGILKLKTFNFIPMAVIKTLIYCTASLAEVMF